MKKQKSTYITDLTHEILINRDLLDEWAKNSKDLEFLELSTEILSDTDLLFSWDCNNILNLKLSAIRSDGKKFELKSGIVIQVDESDKFPMKPFLYKMAIKAMIKKKSMNDIIKEDFVNQDNSVEQINNAERMARMTNLLESVQKMNKYSLQSQIILFMKLISLAIDRFEKESNNFYKKKADEFMLPINESTNSEESISLDLAKSTNLEKEKNPFPFLFRTTEVYNCFLEYQKYLVDFYIDYSYLKKRLDDEKLIFYYKDNDFMKFIFNEMKLIKKKDYDDYVIKGKLDTLKRSSSNYRENVFNTVFENVI